MQKATEEGGHLRAMEQLAFIYENGKHGVAADPEYAVKLLTRCIDNGGGESPLYELGRLFHRGAAGVAKDVPRAVTLYSTASRQYASLRSLRQLALILDVGAEGVEADRLRAREIRWLYNEAKRHPLDSSRLIKDWYSGNS